MVMLGGGNDGFNAFAPISGSDRSRYQTLRGGLAIPAAQLRPAAESYGFHPRLEKLAARYATGRVAVVRGVGQPTNDLSHFTSMATFMAGTSSTSRTTGWLGRYLDGVSEFDSGMRGVTFSSSVPLHLLGQQAKVTAVPDQGGMWGSDATERWERSAFAAVQAYANGPTGLSAWGDRVAANGKAAIGMAETIDTLYHPDLTSTGLARDLTLAARLVNANLGTRVIGVSVGGWDTHSAQLYDHGELLGELDAGIEAFFTTLAPAFRDQTTLATFSEFGRRPEANDSQGTDHGTASVLFVVGENVRGGLHGTNPSLTAFDERNNFVPTVDFRSVYATLLDDWLDADPNAVLGGTFPQLDLFTNVPGGPRNPGPPPPPPNPATPFADWTALVRQQYVDLLLVTPTAERVAPWVSKLQAGTTTPVDLITTFMTSATPVSEIHPVLRAYRACYGRVPTPAELKTQVGVRRTVWTAQGGRDARRRRRVPHQERDPRRQRLRALAVPLDLRHLGLVEPGGQLGRPAPCAQAHPGKPPRPLPHGAVLREPPAVRGAGGLPLRRAAGPGPEQHLLVDAAWAAPVRNALAHPCGRVLRYERIRPKVLLSGTVAPVSSDRRRAEMRRARRSTSRTARPAARCRRRRHPGDRARRHHGAARQGGWGHEADPLPALRRS